MRSIAIVSIAFFIPHLAFASASILGFSAGEDSMVLSSILGEMVQEVSVLNDLAAASKTVAANISFVKDVYATGNDVINSRWEDLTNDFVQDVVMQDPTLATLYTNTRQIVTNQVPQSNQFQRLVGAGFNQFLFYTFGPVPLGRRGDQYALADYRAANLNALAGDETTAMERKRRADAMIAQAESECRGSLEACEKATARLQMLSADSLTRLNAFQAEQMRAQATEIAIRNSERKNSETGRAGDMQVLGNAAKRFGTGGQPTDNILGMP